jgi:nitroreductase
VPPGRGEERAELRERQGPRERDGAAGEPRRHDEQRGIEPLRDDVRVDEDAGTDDTADDDHGGVEPPELSAKGHAPTVRARARLFQKGLDTHIAAPMDIFQAISTRRSIKAFSDRQVTENEIRQLLAAAVQAPNHRMTQPWRFYVLGPEARAAYGRTLGRRKAKRVEEADAAEAVVAKVEATHRDLPAMIAVAMTLDENPEIREEDYAATYMAVQNLSLAAHAMGLGTHVKSGGIMDDPAARAAVGVREGERIVATINVGEPAEIPAAKPRHDAGELTRWVP